MNTKLIGSAAGVVGIGAIAVTIALTTGSSNAAPAQKPADQIVAPVTVSTPAAHSSSSVVVKARPAVKRHPVKAHSVKRAASSAVIVRKAAVVSEPSSDPTTVDPPQPVADPATRGPGGGPLPSMQPPQPPPSSTIELPKMSESATSGP